jgi:phosphoglycolate phosphatase
MIDSIIFDLDGTLWDSVDEIILTWNRVIERHGGFRPPITRAEQEQLMGLQMDEIARRLFSGEQPQRQLQLMNECMQEENEYLAQHGGTLYPQVEETLKRLKEHFRLFIVSNCQKGYIEAFLQAHRLEGYFTDHLCFGETGTSKGETNKLLISRNKLKAPVYVGDTQGDRQSAIDAGIPFIYAGYGFGKVDSCEGSVQSFGELVELFSAKTLTE